MAFVKQEVKAGDIMTPEWGNHIQTQYEESKKDMALPTKAQPVLLNEWTNLGLSDESAYYSKNGLNIVTIGGMISGGSVANPVTIFTLPAGYRPLKNRNFIVANAGTAGTENSVSRVMVRSDGQVSLYKGNATWTSLDGIRFEAEQ